MGLFFAHPLAASTTLCVLCTIPGPLTHDLLGFAANVFSLAKADKTSRTYCSTACSALVSALIAEGDLESALAVAASPVSENNSRLLNSVAAAFSYL